MSADETADRNARYFATSLNYVGNSSYTALWRELGYEHRFVDREFLLTSEGAWSRALGHASGALPLIPWLARTLWERNVCMRKPLEGSVSA